MLTDSSAYFVQQHSRNTFIIDDLERFCYKKPLKASAILTSMGMVALACIHKLRHQQLSDKMKHSFKVIGTLNMIGGGVLLKMMISQWSHIPFFLFINKHLAKVDRSLVQFGMKNSIFCEVKCLKNSEEVGSILIKKESNGDVIPTLKINAQNEFERGYIQGRLIGDKIEQVYYRVFKPMCFLLRILTGDYSGKQLKDRVKAIQFPNEVLDEMNGILKGIQDYAKIHGYQTEITLENFKEVHVLADTYKRIGLRKFLGSYPSTLGCSTAILKTQNSMVMVRTLDWPGVQDINLYTLVKEYQIGSRTVRIQTFAGFCGSLTASNSDGLCIVINELGGYTGCGVSYSLLAKKLIENASNIQEALTIIESGEYIPASSHHLIMMDKTRAYNVQFIDNEKVHHVELNKPGFLAITNHACDSEGKIIPGSQTDITSVRRAQKMFSILDNWYKNMETLNILEVALKTIKCVNVFNTTSATIFWENKDIHAFDSHYAASHL